MTFPIKKPLQSLLIKVGIIQPDYLVVDNVHLWGRTYIQPTSQSTINSERTSEIERSRRPL